MDKFRQWLIENTEPKVSAAKFARDLGVSPSLVTHWKKGTRKPGIDQLRKLSKRTGIKLEDFLA
jgi:transcriptional regulator with XRE-family HTH domain